MQGRQVAECKQWILIAVAVGKHGAQIQCFTTLALHPMISAVTSCVVPYVHEGCLELDVVIPNQPEVIGAICGWHEEG
jgi:hypothetical protein